MTETFEAPSNRSNRSLIASFLAPPVAWTVQFLAIYVLSESVCAGGQIPFSLVDPTIVVVAVVVITLIALAVVGWVGLRSFRLWRELADGQQAWEAENRTPFMALASFILSAFFALVIVLTVVPFLVLQPCGWIST